MNINSYLSKCVDVGKVKTYN